MEEKSTSKLMEILKHTRKGELAALQDDLTVQSHSFITYMDQLIQQRNLKRQDIFQKADMPQKYGINCSMEKAIPKIGINCCGSSLLWE